MKPKSGTFRQDRRRFLKSAAAVGLASSFLGARHPLPPLAYGHPKYGPLQPDPDGILMLPKGFSYKLFSQAGEVMDDGWLVPGAQDGMAAFPGERGRTILVRNHELSANDRRQQPFSDKNPRTNLRDDLKYDPGSADLIIPGGTTTLIYDTEEKRLVKHWLSLTGTMVNCAGGRTPWHTWLSCEETDIRAGNGFSKDHGYCFEVDPKASELQPPKPLKAMGRFRREAVAIDPGTGSVYQTEDHYEGLLYRFIPDVRNDLAKGGKLQALAIEGMPGIDTSNHRHRDAHIFMPGVSLPVTWVDIDRPENPDNDIYRRGRAKGAAVFCRGEGIDYGAGSVYFTCTEGGPAKIGQVWRYTPDTHMGETEERGTLELLLEPNNAEILSKIDNLCVAPNGDLILAEDGPDPNRILGVTPAGQVYPIAANVMNRAEVAGPTWSPDGSTLFFNLFHPGATVAVTGPW